MISDRYGTKVVETKRGKIYTGVVFQDTLTTDLIVLDLAGQETKLAKDEVQQITPSRLSSMPSGLLNQLEMKEIADLFAFLRQASPAKVTRRPRP